MRMERERDLGSGGGLGRVRAVVVSWIAVGRWLKRQRRGRRRLILLISSGVSVGELWGFDLR